ncbi:hypothetical protein ACRZ5O_32365 [Pseudomonas protegens]|uniref:hypothetical protein n=1 Tax=Pseudomonas protegens TaxID=380021 RepID=UPI001883A236|nr:hypothetical protein [Pseudomonas protegens]MBF0639437.1 hypothetical protein [Pseudomonas protegens]
MTDITFRTQGAHLAGSTFDCADLSLCAPEAGDKPPRCPAQKKLPTSASDSPGNPVIIGACFSRHLPSADHERIHEH